MRNIDDILHFRSDISPFLVHLTRGYNGNTASENLESIITDRELIAGEPDISDARLVGRDYYSMLPEEKQRFFGAVCLTETPLNEIHCFLEIGGRHFNLQPYGLVFLKKPLQERGVSPVIYLNNELNNQYPVVQALFQIIERDPDSAQLLLPLVSSFGEKVHPNATEGRVDFGWEREWRFPSAYGSLTFSAEEVFVGLCPDAEIPYFEQLFPRVSFVDPTKNMKWYATKLIQARQRLDMKYSVV